MRGTNNLFVRTTYWCPEGQLRGVTQNFGEFSHKKVSYRNSYFFEVVLLGTYTAIPRFHASLEVLKC